MMNHDDTIKQIPNYVLGILPEDRIGEIERHVLLCKTCQQMVARERNLGHVIHEAMEAATRPDPLRLQLLMPPIPHPHPGSSAFRGLRKQLQPAFIIVLLILGGLMVNGMFATKDLPALVVTVHAATATSTNTPTATLVHSNQEAPNTIDRQVRLEPSDGAKLPSALPTLRSGPVETPGVGPTPAAAARQAIR